MLNDYRSDENKYVRKGRIFENENLVIWKFELKLLIFIENG